jgi:hypothetical protein
MRVENETLTVPKYVSFGWAETARSITLYAEALWLIVGAPELEFEPGHRHEGLLSDGPTRCRRNWRGGRRRTGEMRKINHANTNATRRRVAHLNQPSPTRRR